MVYGEERAIEYRKKFPGLSQTVYGQELIYLDNAATNQVAQAVIDAMGRHMINESANTHRGIHYLSERATENLERARREIAAFIGAREQDCLCFNSGTTAGINTIARGLALRLGPGDAVLVTRMEHHSNFLPWQQLCLSTGAEFRVTPLDENGDVDLEAFGSLLADGRVKAAALAHVSNVTGAVNPVKRMTELAHRSGALCVVDGAQSVRGISVNVSDMDCDFFCFSAHKMVGPTGVGAMYGKREALESLAPSSFGGGMVDSVGTRSSEFSGIPFRFEAGTPNIVGIAGFRAAAETLNEIGREWIAERESALTAYLESALREIDSVKLLGSPKRRSGAVSFSVRGRHPYDLASVMDKQGVAVRVGHHCAIPCLEHFGEEAVLRISPAFYNLTQELDKALLALQRAIDFFSRWDG